MWKKVPGRVEQGHQVASGAAASKVYPEGTIKMQLPFFRERGLDLSNFHPATLNISIAPLSFRLSRPKFRFQQVCWTKLHPPEDFLFSPCRIGVDNEWQEGIIYMPDPATKVRHFQDPSIVEVIAPRLPGIGYGSRVELELNLDEVDIEGA